MDKFMVKVEARVKAPVSEVWEKWTVPTHIVKWNHANEDWHTTQSSNDLKVGGRFCNTMQAKDGSMGFDLGGEYIDIEEHKLIKYVLDDGRNVEVSFETDGRETHVREVFEAEEQNSLDMQQKGWQAILDSFRAYAST